MTEQTDQFLSPTEIPILRKSLQAKQPPKDTGMFTPTKVPQRKLKVFIATPNLHSIVIKQAKNIVDWFNNQGIDFMWHAPSGVVPHDRARNNCWKRFLQSKYEVIFWADAYTALPKESDLYRLLKVMNDGVCENCGQMWTGRECCKAPKHAVVDMIAAVPQAFQVTKGGVPTLVPLAYRWDKEKGGYFQHWTTKPGKIDWVDVSTIACTIVRRKVMEKVRHPPFKFTMSDEWGIAGYGEDFYFCEGVREAGFRIWADYSILAHHYKMQDTRMVNDTLIRELAAKMAAIKGEDDERKHVVEETDRRGVDTDTVQGD